VTFEDAQLDIELMSRSQAPIRVKEWRRKRGPNVNTDPPWLHSFASKIVRTAMSSLPELQMLVITSQGSGLSDSRKRALRGRCPRTEIALLLEIISQCDNLKALEVRTGSGTRLCINDFLSPPPGFYVSPMFEGLENLDLDVYDHESDGQMRHSPERLCAHPLTAVVRMIAPRMRSIAISLKTAWRDASAAPYGSYNKQACRYHCPNQLSSDRGLRYSVSDILPAVSCPNLRSVKFRNVEPDPEAIGKFIALNASTLKDSPCASGLASIRCLAEEPLIHC
jgi:hypothetical protein